MPIFGKDKASGELRGVMVKVRNKGAFIWLVTSGTALYFPHLTLRVSAAT